MKRPDRKDGGMILVEVMVALVILTGGSMVIYQSYRNSLRVIRQSQDLFRATLSLESRMGELEHTGHSDEAKKLFEQGLYTH